MNELSGLGSTHAMQRIGKWNSSSVRQYAVFSQSAFQDLTIYQNITHYAATAIIFLNKFFVFSYCIAVLAEKPN